MAQAIRLMGLVMTFKADTDFFIFQETHYNIYRVGISAMNSFKDRDDIIDILTLSSLFLVILLLFLW